MQHIHLTNHITVGLQGLRLDQALAKLFPEYSRSCLQNWITMGYVTVNGQKIRPRDKAHPGQLVEIHAPLEDQKDWQPQNIPLDILFEDESVIVINKQSGLVVHPGAGNLHSTLVNALLYHAPELKVLPRAGIVHRLDKDTSGILIIARSLEAHNYLIKEMQNRAIHREYEAIVQGNIIAGGSVNKSVGRHPTQRTKMATLNRGGKPAITHYKVIEKFRAHTSLVIQLETGRTHQIRVHMAFISHPIVGDPLYGGRARVPAGCSEELLQRLQSFKRQALHAKKLIFKHPLTGQTMSLTAPLPEDIQQLITSLRDDLHYKH
jgi:23S rRNA pseudouridine1911/1915/1917 synthase